MKIGIPDGLRKEIWLFFTRALHTRLQQNYYELLENPDQTVLGLIQKDLNRTFPFIPELDQNSLMNVLIAYSQFDSVVGYCQGMGFVVTVLLLVIKNEELTFWSFVYIMYDKNWRELYTNDTPKLKNLMTVL